MNTAHNSNSPSDELPPGQSSPPRIVSYQSIEDTEEHYFMSFSDFTESDYLEEHLESEQLVDEEKGDRVETEGAVVEEAARGRARQRVSGERQTGTTETAGCSNRAESREKNKNKVCKFLYKSRSCHFEDSYMRPPAHGRTTFLHGCTTEEAAPLVPKGFKEAQEKNQRKKSLDYYLSL